MSYTNNEEKIGDLSPIVQEIDAINTRLDGGASEVDFENVGTGLESTNVQDAIVEVNNDLANIDVYVGEEDGKLHFIDSAGADTVLPFNSGNKTFSGTLTRIGGSCSNGNGISIFDISSLCPNDYMNLTIDDICVQPANFAYCLSSQSVIDPSSCVYTYDSTNGQLTMRTTGYRPTLTKSVKAFIIVPNPT